MASVSTATPTAMHPRAAAAELELYAAAVEALPSALVGIDHRGEVQFANAAACRLFAWEPSVVIGAPIFALAGPWAQPPVRAAVEGALRRSSTTDRIDDIPFTRPDGSAGVLGMRVSRFSTSFIPEGGLVVSASDITERRQLEIQFGQAQKLESIGRLAAGIAHEINTPTQYVGDNLRFLKDSFDALFAAIEAARVFIAGRIADASTRVEAATAAEAMAAADVDFLRDEMPRAVAQALEGVERTARIVRAMKEFSHPATDELALADLNQAINSTATVSRNEWKYVADLDLRLDPMLPPVPCLVNELNQVILNLIVNSAHAIADANRTGGRDKGRIAITTREHDRNAIIEIEDDGAGIPESIIHRIYDPFFTTKPVGKGTGQGLAIARSVVVDKHRGTIVVDSKPGIGTKFTITLPLDAAPGGRS